MPIAPERLDALATDYRGAAGDAGRPTRCTSPRFPGAEGPGL